MSGGLTLPGLAQRVSSLEERFPKLELGQREIARTDGRLLATDGAVDALSNQQWEFADFVREQRAANAATLKAINDLRKSAERSAALPLAIVAYFISEKAEASAQTTIGSTLLVLAFAFFAPELLAKYFRKTPLGKMLLPQEEEAPPPVTPAQPPAGPARERDTFTNER